MLGKEGTREYHLNFPSPQPTEREGATFKHLSVSINFLREKMRTDLDQDKTGNF